MTQIGTIQDHVQGFRSVYKSELHPTTSVPLDSPNITHIDCSTDQDTNKDVIFWEDIQQAFDKALFVRNKTKMLPFVRGKDYRILEPRRIAAAPDVVFDVVVDDTLITATDSSTADMIASLQRTVQELLLNMPRQTPIESAIHDPPCDNEPEDTQDNNHTNNPENISLIQGPQVSECYSKDSNNGTIIDTLHPEATRNVAERLNDPQDESAAMDMTLMQTMVLANQGDVQAKVALGDRYKDGRELHQDYQAAMDCYSKAAEQGHPRAQYGIGLLYNQGFGNVPQDHTKAFDWLHKSALQGYPDAQAKVSQAYTDGAGVPKDNIKAMEWGVKAAENGHAGMQCNMGAAYENGQGVPQSDSRSFEWYLKSADQGYAEAQARVASAFEAGRGVPEDDRKAVEWYTKAADRGLAVAQFALGRIHQLGHCGLPIDWSKAVGWLFKAAVQGHTEAQFMLREICDRSTFGYEPDIFLDLETQSNIKKWFMSAADQGVAQGQVYMADMYADGRGVQKDESKAFQWYLRAAKQGDEVAQRRVGYMYKTGLGVTKNREKAVEWYVRMATRGNDWWAAYHLRDMIAK